MSIKKRGEIVVNAEWRFPSDELDPDSIEDKVHMMRRLLTALGEPATTINGYSTEGGLVLTEGKE